MLDSSKLETDPEIARRVPQGAGGDRRESAGGVLGMTFEIGGGSPVLGP